MSPTFNPPNCLLTSSILLRPYLFFFFFNDPATTEIYPFSLHDALPIFLRQEEPLDAERPVLADPDIGAPQTLIPEPQSRLEGALRPIGTLAQRSDDSVGHGRQMHVSRRGGGVGEVDLVADPMLPPYVTRERRPGELKRRRHRCTQRGSSLPAGSAKTKPLPGVAFHGCVAVPLQVSRTFAKTCATSWRGGR